MDRTILHSDMNSCSASIELLHHRNYAENSSSWWRPEARHGYVLAKDQWRRRLVFKQNGLMASQAGLPNITSFLPDGLVPALF